MAPPSNDEAAATSVPIVTVTDSQDSNNAGATETAVVLDAQSEEEVAPPDADEETRLKFLTTGTRAQDDLERDIGRQADQLLTEQADARDKKRIEKAEAEAKRAEAAIQKLRNRLALPAVDTHKARLRGEIAAYQLKIEDLDKEMDAVQQRINERHAAAGEEEDAAQDGANGPLPNESRRDFLIRTGKITPFSRLAQNHAGSGTLGEVILDAEMEDMQVRTFVEFIDEVLSILDRRGAIHTTIVDIR